MSLRHLPKFLVFSASICLLCGISAPIARAADDEKETPGAPRLLPEDALAYIRIDDVDQLREDFGTSSVGRMMADPKLKPLAGDFYQILAELFEQVGSQLGISLDELLAIPSGQVAIAAMPGNISEREEEMIEEDAEDDESDEAIRRRIAKKRRQQNSIGGLFMVDAGKNIDRLMSLIEQIEGKMVEQGYVRRTSKIEKTTLVRLLPPRSGRPEIEYFELEGTAVLGIGHKTAEKALDQWLKRSEDSSLADRNDFTSVMSRCVGAEETRPQVTFFLDPYHFVERMVKRGGAAAFVWPIIEELGIGKIRGVGGSVFSGGEFFEDISHLHVLIDPPRDGFFGVLRPETGDSTPPNWVPAEVSGYTSIHWDFPTTYDNFDKVLGKFQGPEPLKRFVEEPMQKAIDVSIRDEVIAKLSGHYVSCRWLEPPVRLNSQTQLHAFEVTDALAAKDVIARIRQRRPEDLKPETISGKVVYFAKAPRKMPQGLRAPEPNITVIGDWVIFTDSRKFTERVLRASSDSIPRLVTVPEYELVSSELGGKLDGETPFLVSFMRSSDYIRQIYDLAQSSDTRRFLKGASESNPFAGKMIEMLERNEMPAFEKFEKYFAPSGSFAYDEPSGMHLGSFTLKADD
ncbi:MAG: DUF3352 domain-containing protein [Rubripirellula sp.]